jgi:hypothetical protein
MTAATLAIILEYGLRYGPEAIALVRRMLARPEAVTDADFDALLAILQRTGRSYFDAPAGSTPTRTQ